MCCPDVRGATMDLLSDAFALTMVAWPTAMTLSRAALRPRGDAAAPEQVWDRRITTGPADGGRA